MTKGVEMAPNIRCSASIQRKGVPVAAFLVCVSALVVEILWTALLDRKADSFSSFRCFCCRFRRLGVPGPDFLIIEDDCSLAIGCDDLAGGVSNGIFFAEASRGCGISVPELDCCAAFSVDDGMTVRQSFSLSLEL